MAIRAFVFDAYGTLFDLTSLTRRCLQLWPTEGARVAELWRSKQLEYMWLLSSMRRYQPYSAVTRAALVYATRARRVTASRAECEAVAAELGCLRPFPEASEVLLSLKRQGHKLALLSNGSPDMLGPLLRDYHDAHLFDHVLSSDQVRSFTPAPEPYLLALRQLQMPNEEVLFVSANGWNVAGAHAARLPTVWINRNGDEEERLGAEPRAELRSLRELTRLALTLNAES